LSATAQDPLTTGLVAYYKFNGNVHDESGAGNDGTLIGYDWKYGLDRFGQQNSLYLNTTSTPAATLDGTYVVAPRPASVDFNQDFTLSAWVNIPDIVYYVHNLISNGVDRNGPNLRVISHSEASGADYLQFVSDFTATDVHATLDPRPNTWWQAAAVRSGTNISLYRNGSLVATGPVGIAVTNSPVIWLGRHICPGYPSTCPSAYPLFGGIDDVRIYNRALSKQEIHQLYGYERNPLPNLTIEVKTVRLTLNLVPNTANQLDASSDLKTWHPYIPSFTATNSILVQDVEISDENKFFRLRALTP
jgi:hypothetical protein